MNERIKELWNQANSQYYQSESNQPLPQFIFAELIVKECIDIAYREGDNVAYLALYFGVEE